MARWSVQELDSNGKPIGNVQFITSSGPTATPTLRSIAPPSPQGMFSAMQSAMRQAAAKMAPPKRPAPSPTVIVRRVPGTPVVEDGTLPDDIEYGDEGLEDDFTATSGGRCNARASGGRYGW